MEYLLVLTAMNHYSQLVDSSSYNLSTSQQPDAIIGRTQNEFHDQERILANAIATFMATHEITQQNEMRKKKKRKR